jgi:hypothetical protein
MGSEDFSLVLQKFRAATFSWRTQRRHRRGLSTPPRALQHRRARTRNRRANDVRCCERMLGCLDELR